MATENSKPREGGEFLQVPQGPLDCPPLPPSHSETTPTIGPPSPRMSKLVETLDAASGNSLMFRIRKQAQEICSDLLLSNLQSLPFFPSSGCLAQVYWVREYRRRTGDLESLVTILANIVLQAFLFFEAPVRPFEVVIT